MTRQSIKNARLVDSDIPSLRRRILTKATTVAQEADRFGVGIETIRRAVRGETFRHIKDFLEEEILPGLRAPHATREEITPDLTEDAQASLKKVLNAADADEEQSASVDYFLEARGVPPKEKKE